MKTRTYTLAALLAVAILGSAAPCAVAGGRDHWEERHYHRDQHDYRHGHHHRHHDGGWERHYRPAYIYESPVVYAPAYIAPPPPPVIYRPAYSGYRADPAITIGIGIPPIVIPLR